MVVESCSAAHKETWNFIFSVKLLYSNWLIHSRHTTDTERHKLFPVKLFDFCSIQYLIRVSIFYVIFHRRRYVTWYPIMLLIAGTIWFLKRNQMELSAIVTKHLASRSIATNVTANVVNLWRKCQNYNKLTQVIVFC